MSLGRQAPGPLLASVSPPVKWAGWFLRTLLALPSFAVTYSTPNILETCSPGSVEEVEARSCCADGEGLRLAQSHAEPSSETALGLGSIGLRAA